MPRTKRKSAPQVIWPAAILLVVIAAAGGFYLSRQVGDPLRTVQSLDVGDYLHDANGLRGNVYKVKGEVHEQLAWRPDGARLIAVRVRNGGGDGDVIPLLFPATLRDNQVQKGQVFFFQVEVIEGGVLSVSALVKA